MAMLSYETQNLAHRFFLSVRKSNSGEKHGERGAGESDRSSGIQTMISLFFVLKNNLSNENHL